MAKFQIPVGSSAHGCLTLLAKQQCSRNNAKDHRISIMMCMHVDIYIYMYIHMTHVNHDRPHQIASLKTTNILGQKYLQYLATCIFQMDSTLSETDG